MVWNLATIGLLLAVLIFGYLIGLLEARLRISKKEGRPAKPPADEALPSLEGEIEVLRAWRTRAGKLGLEMGGQRIEGKEMLQPEQHRRLVNLLLELRPWLEAAPDLPPARSGQEQPAKPPIPAKTKEPKVEQPAVAAFSIVAQIDQILQDRLTGTPLAGRGIHLQESPEGGVMVWVGLQRFEGIDAVLDPEVKAAIRQAVEAWEKKP
ncbi:MAG: hypothetical protein MUO30_05495 [Anaerolineales bacterium]|nr:hypothetical protein [Anaerolineales bacterium]